MKKDLVGNILPFWLEKAVDRKNGGFYGEILRDGTVKESAPKGLILNARILWTFSAACRLFGSSDYRLAADRAFAYLVEHFLDREGEGAHYLLRADGGPENSAKFTYAHGFLLYAFSEYARATGSAEAADRAGEVFRFIETRCKLGEGKYAEFAKGSVLPPMPPPPPRKEGEPAPPPFDFSKLLSMNNHLHIIEPITCYFRINHSREVEEALSALLEVFLDKIYNKNFGHFDLFFGEDWTPLSHTNSYGHDIEGSWLILEAAEVLRQYAADQGRAETLLARSRACAAHMAEAVLREGLDPQNGAVYDEGDREGHITRAKKVWWAQAEGIVGFYNAYQITGADKFLTAASRLWDYIEAHIIDREGGEWFGTGTDSPTDENSDFKVNPWKCPYHNARAAFEMIERTKG
jgi:mannobiose 2-epimerase